MTDYTKTWGPIFFYPRDMTVTNQFSYYAPEPDLKQHLDAQGIPTCFLAWANLIHRQTKGWWFTGNLPLATLIGDANTSVRKLLGFSYNKLPEYGGPFVSDIGSFLAELDGVRIIDRELPNGENQTERFNQILTGTNIKFGLFQYASAGALSWVNSHVWSYGVFGEYITTNPPVARKVTIRVYDVVTAKPIANAQATLTSGVTVIANARTDNAGSATLNAFDSSYALKIYVAGYTPYPFEATVDLILGDAAIDIPLSPIPSEPFPLPSWWWIPVVAAGGITGLYFLNRVLTHRKEIYAPPPPPQIILLK